MNNNWTPFIVKDGKVDKYNNFPNTIGDFLVTDGEVIWVDSVLLDPYGKVYLIINGYEFEGLQWMELPELPEEEEE